MDRGSALFKSSRPRSLAITGSLPRHHLAPGCFVSPLASPVGLAAGSRASSSSGGVGGSSSPNGTAASVMTWASLRLASSAPPPSLTGDNVLSAGGSGWRSRSVSTRALDLSTSPNLSTLSSLSSMDGGGEPSMLVHFDNDSDDDCTVITLEGKDQSHLLVSLTSVFISAGLQVVSASITSEEGRILDVFRVRTSDGKKLTSSSFDGLHSQIMQLTTSSSRSSKPAIYGIVAAAEVERLRPLSGDTASASNEVQSLELTAAEMAQAAAELVAKEKEILVLRGKKADPRLIATKEAGRTEAAAALERRMAAMEAVLAARRTMVLEPVANKPMNLIEQMKPAVAARSAGGPGCGSGYEILLQGFTWESHKHKYYKTLMGQINEIAEAGFTAIWLPPPSDSVSPQGYLPRDLYCLDSAYGTQAELRDLISELKAKKIKPIADIVINHRCAHNQGPDGKWNKFGGRLAWDATAICCNNPSFGGKGNPKAGDDYAAAPNVDHSQERVRQDIIAWMKWLRNSIGYEGWRFDYVRGYLGSYCKLYTDETVPLMAFGEYWDSCDYTDGVLNYNQDSHRQRTVNWCDSTGGTAAAFDFTTKGILQEAVSRREYWRLVDAQGRPPGVLGMWPSRAITFLDNHDTGSTLNHWPYPEKHLPEGYAYLLTHPGTPTIFYDHFWEEKNNLKKTVRELLALRKKHGIHCRSKVTVKKATNDTYAATIDDKVALKIGYGDWSPNSVGIKFNNKELKLACSGFNFAVWTVQP